jgi:geranylgeranyl transferase type-2 subunit beta
VIDPSTACTTLLAEKHLDYLGKWLANTSDYEYQMTEHLRMSGACVQLPTLISSVYVYCLLTGLYWCITSLDVLGALDRVDVPAILEYVNSCMHTKGGFSAHPDHDPHMLYTLRFKLSVFLA